MAGLFYAFWLLFAALAGWAGGRATRVNAFGTGADILFGLTGAFMVRWSFENIGISPQHAYVILLSISGAAVFPVAIRLAVRLHDRSKLRSRLPSG
jgi:uncharacterized membrane protein YeaQ/YmgE (transglycosylase-associated protein family)